MKAGDKVRLKRDILEIDETPTIKAGTMGTVSEHQIKTDGGDSLDCWKITFDEPIDRYECVYVLKGIDTNWEVI